MKKIFLIILFASQLFAQNPLLDLFNDVSLDADAKSYIARMTIAPDITQQIRISDLFKYYKEHNVWDKIREAWIYAGHDSANSLLGIKNVKNSVCAGTIGFTQYQGFRSAGANGYLNTQLLPSMDGGGVFTLNSFSAGVYSRTNVSEAKEDLGTVGNSPSSSNLRIFLRTSTTALWNVNQSANITDTISTSACFYIITRTASDAVAAYNNGLWTSAGTNVSTALSNFVIYVGARNNLGTADNIATKEYAFAFVGSALNATEVLTIVTGFEVYMDALGKGVIP